MMVERLVSQYPLRLRAAMLTVGEGGGTHPGEEPGNRNSAITVRMTQCSTQYPETRQ